MATNTLDDLMEYQYTGYLKTILYAPDEEQRDSLDYIEFTAEDLRNWTTRDVDSEREWRDIPAHRSGTDEGVRLVGRFEDVKRIDLLGPDDPSFWVPLGSLGVQDDRFPIDVVKYPIIEVTYRCTSDNAQLVWVWHYDGGLHFDRLPDSRRWLTLARLVPHHGFPESISSLVFRLYTTTRTTESVEISSVRFRALSKTEAEALRKADGRLKEKTPPKRYDLLDEFLPLGVTLDAEAVRRNAEMLGIGLDEYWNLALEDIVLHHHNCITLEKVEHLTTSEWDALLREVARFGIRLLPSFDLPVSQDPETVDEIIEARVKPHADSPSLLGWILREEPPEIDFPHLLDLRRRMEQADPNHPLVVVTRHPSTFPLYAPYFAASGMNHHTSHAPWDYGEMIATHAPLSGGQQFWIEAPAFIYATGTPDWSTCPELRLTINLAFANGIRGWFSYAYHNDPIWVTGSCQRSLTGPFLTFSDLWLELDRRMERYEAISPMLLESEPGPLPNEWFVETALADAHSQLPEGVPPVSAYCLHGPDYEIYFMVSNDVRGMSKLNVDLPANALRGQSIYDISDFVQHRHWTPMPLKRHVEMFPGQAKLVMVASPKTCDRIRDMLSGRLIEDDRQQLDFHLRLARNHNLDVGSVEKIAAQVPTWDALQDLELMGRARDMVVDLLYDAPEVRDLRSSIIAVSSAVCACDGTLCRVMGRGRIEEAREWGLKLIPLAREMTHFRLELRQGNSASVADSAEDLRQRTLALLEQIHGLL